MDDQLRDAFDAYLVGLENAPEWALLSSEVPEPTVLVEERRRTRSPFRPASAAFVAVLVGAVAILVGPAAIDLAGGGDEEPSRTVRHAVLSFSQTLILECLDGEVVDNGAFDEFVVDIWIDRDQGFAKLDVTYPDATRYELLLAGVAPEWTAAWSRGEDRGRRAGCLETHDNGFETQSIAGWAWFDSAPLFFEQFLGPVASEGGSDSFPVYLSAAAEIADGQYLFEGRFPSGGFRRIVTELDTTGTWIAKELHEFQLPDHSSEIGTFAIIEAESFVSAPPGTFDTTRLTALWTTSGPPVVTTATDRVRP